MFEVQITVGCPDLVAAATILANAMAGVKPTTNPAATNVSGTAPVAQYGAAAPVAAQTPAPPTTQTITDPTPTAPANPTQTGYPSMPTSYPSNAAPVAAAPVAQAPTFTLEQVSTAGANLITAQPAKMQDLMALLQQYGVQTIQALPTDKLGAFATALRGMGAQI